MLPGSEPARWILRGYFDELIRRYYGRPATEEEIDSALRDYPSDDLAPPGGVLLVASERGGVVGCAGLRLLPDGVGEVTRVFVVPAARETGLGERLMRELEARARALRVRELRLDSRSDLVEATRLYARLGYEPTAPFNHGTPADRWFRKPLA
jgi:GNAT superfamily N-acetyltransferase